MRRLFPRLALGMTLLGLSICIVVLGDEPKKTQTTNRLAKETSPYLLLHAHNPVDWYPWGPEAFAKAKAENKPIFLSVGYSSCYWCHVMERESFSDPAIAKALNAGFICIKVDREERPDIDQLYMTALQAFSGSGGWPMSMFLFPDGRPFFGGIYFPPHEKDGATGFDGLVDAVLKAWKDKRELLDRDATEIVAIVKKSVDRSSTLGRVALSRELSTNGRKELAESYDPKFGGYGFSETRPNRPKFPEPVNLIFMLDQDRRLGPSLGASEPLNQVLTTLDQMARGGIRDHLAGGYHRYSTKRDWSIPHFEKMLYDNAQLVTTHLLAFERTGDVRWRREAEATFEFLSKSLTSPEGGFYSALDAESEAEEGHSYVWTKSEIDQILGATDAPIFDRVYGLDAPPNFEKNRFILLEPTSRGAASASLNLDPKVLEARLVPMRARLLAVREKRPAPMRDDKILTAWNGLAMAAYADGFRVLKDPRYRDAANRAADFLLAKLQTPDGRLLRTYCEGKAKLAAYLEDYAFLAHGLLRLHEATGDPKRLAQARALADRMINDFGDVQNGGFFYTATDHESLLARSKDPFDNAVPGANSVAIRVLVALGRITREPRYLDLAGRALDGFSASLARSPQNSPLMLVALDEYLDQRSPAKSPTASAPELKTPGVVVATLGAVTAIPDNGYEVPVTLTIQPGFHIYANEPGAESISPTRVTLVKVEGFALDRVDYPEGIPKTIAANGPEKISLYENSVTFKARIKKTSGVNGRHLIHLQVKYQACNDRACLAPGTLDIPVTFDSKERK